jgi:hypothetical protein
MRSDPEPTQAGKEYAAAHAAHYAEKNLRDALQLYRAIVAVHSNSQEAKYSREQIQNIANSVVPKQELLDAQIKLVLAHFKQDALLDTGMPVAPLASKPPT